MKCTKSFLINYLGVFTFLVKTPVAQLVRAPCLYKMYTVLDLVQVRDAEVASSNLAGSKLLIENQVIFKSTHLNTVKIS